MRDRIYGYKLLSMESPPSWKPENVCLCGAALQIGVSEVYR